MKSCDFLPVIIAIMISRLLCWFVLLFWLDWPQSRLAASWCAVLIVSHPVSSTFPRSSPFIPSLIPFISSSPNFCFFKSMSLGALDSLYPACHGQTSPPSGSPLIPRSFPFHSSLNSVNSSDSRGSSGSHSHSPSSSSSSSSSHHLFHHHHPRHRYRSSTLPQQAPARLSSISSHDSGFMSSSQDQYMSSKSSSPMPAETKVRTKKPQRPTLNHTFGSEYIHMVETVKPHMPYALQVIVVRETERKPQISNPHKSFLTHYPNRHERQLAGSSKHMWSWWTHFSTIIIIT